MSKKASFWIVLSALVGAMLGSAWVIVARDATRHPAGDRATTGYLH